jgi:hypothetical protein
MEGLAQFPAWAGFKSMHFGHAAESDSENSSHAGVSTTQTHYVVVESKESEKAMRDFAKALPNNWATKKTPKSQKPA